MATKDALQLIDARLRYLKPELHNLEEGEGKAELNGFGFGKGFWISATLRYASEIKTLEKIRAHLIDEACPKESKDV